MHFDEPRRAAAPRSSRIEPSSDRKQAPASRRRQVIILSASARLGHRFSTSAQMLRRGMAGRPKLMNRRNGNTTANGPISCAALKASHRGGAVHRGLRASRSRSGANELHASHRGKNPRMMFAKMANATTATRIMIGSPITTPCRVRGPMKRRHPGSGAPASIVRPLAPAAYRLFAATPTTGTSNRMSRRGRTPPRACPPTSEPPRDRRVGAFHRFDGDNGSFLHDDGLPDVAAGDLVGHLVAEIKVLLHRVIRRLGREDTRLGE